MLFTILFPLFVYAKDCKCKVISENDSFWTRYHSTRSPISENPQLSQCDSFHRICGYDVGTPGGGTELKPRICENADNESPTESHLYNYN